MKDLLRFIYKISISILILIGVFWGKRNNEKVCFCGAFKGSIGGPLVKSKLLIDKFGQSYLNFGILYTLSGMPYVSPRVLRIAKRKNIPIVHNQNGVFYEGWYGHGWQDRNKEMAAIYQKADIILFQSKFSQSSAIKFLGKPNGTEHIIYNAVDTNLFVPRVAKNKQEGLTFLVGSKNDNDFGRLRGAVIGLKFALNSGLNCNLVIAGPASKAVKVKLHTLTCKLGLNEKIKVFGSYNRLTAPTIFGNADAFITLDYNDNCPNKVLEALSCGLPVIYSDTGGTPELVSSDCGVSLSCRNSWDKVFYPEESIVGPAMVEVSEKLGEMSYMSRQRALEKFDTKIWFQKHEQIFREFS